MFDYKSLRSWRVNTLEFRFSIAMSILSVGIIIFFLIWNTKEKSIVQTKMPHNDTITHQVSINKKHAKANIAPSKVKHTNTIQKHAINVLPKKIKPPVKQVYGYIVQLGAFKSRQHANELRDKLHHKQWHASILQKSNQLYAVYIGPFKDKKTAQNMKDRLKRHEKINGFMLELP